ncbi:MAG: nucleoside triphosphate pyrophosphatase YhdE [Acidimicrobiia bacterium]|nr:MAG: nucleoside triphosphate pyrophosphatase YhdE [Acidimicrobiia bacterium]
MRLILASTSPRRSLLLRAAGFTFDTIAPDIDESVLDEEAPGEYVLRLGETKAGSVAVATHDVVLGADTTVVLDGAMLGKPADADEAVSMLRSLVGRTHSVLTGWSLMSESMKRFGIEESLVTFNDRTEDELRGYVYRTEPYDKAGAYAIQGDDGWLITGVSGSRSNVMGLPIREIVDALADFGITRSTPDR